MKFSIHFDPSTDALAAVVASVTGLYQPLPAGNVAPAAVTDTDDTPQAGEQSADPATLDANGIPHDERIHSKIPTLTGKGMWRARKGVAAAVVATVTAELLARVGGAGATATVITPPAGLTAPAPLAAPAPLTAPAPLAAPANAPYEDLVKYIVDNMNTPANPNGRLTQDWTKGALLHFGVADGLLQNLATAGADQIGTIKSAIVAAIAS